MDFKDTIERKALNDILLSLAQDGSFHKDKSKKKSIYLELEKIYAPKQGATFRHYYSDIFAVLVMIRNDHGNADLNTLCANLADILYGYKPQNKNHNGNVIDISENIKKLYDHVNLDVARMNLSDGNDRIVSGEENITHLKSRIIEIERSLQSASLKIEEYNRQLANQQKEYITILGIFASIVLAFVGSFAFTASTFNNIATADIAKLMIVISILGIMFLNLLMYLIDFLLRINDKLCVKQGNALCKKNFANITLIISGVIGLALYLSH